MSPGGGHLTLSPGFRQFRMLFSARAHARAREPTRASENHGTTPGYASILATMEGGHGMTMLKRTL